MLHEVPQTRRKGYRPRFPLFEDALSKLGVEPEHVEGRATGWILIDFGTVVVHIFDKQSREYYNIERLWQDAVIKTAEDILG